MSTHDPDRGEASNCSTSRLLGALTLAPLVNFHPQISYNGCWGRGGGAWILSAAREPERHRGVTRLRTLIWQPGNERGPK